MLHFLPELVKQVRGLSYYAEEYSVLVSVLCGVNESPPSFMAFPRGNFKTGFIFWVCVCITSSTMAHVNDCRIQQSCK